METYPQFDLEKEGYKIGQIICFNGQTHNPKRVIFSERLGCFALQNKGGEIGRERRCFGDFTEQDGLGFWGSLDDCFTLSLTPGAKKKPRYQIEIIGFQEVVNEIANQSVQATAKDRRA